MYTTVVFFYKIDILPGFKLLIWIFCGFIVVFSVVKLLNVYILNLINLFDAHYTFISTVLKVVTFWQLLSLSNTHLSSLKSFTKIIHKPVNGIETGSVHQPWVVSIMQLLHSSFSDLVSANWEPTVVGLKATYKE